jgi:hypothetical protein
VNGVIPQVVYAPPNFDYSNAPNYYDPYYTTIPVAGPIWNQPAYYPTVTVEAPVTVIQSVSINLHLHLFLTNSAFSQIATLSKQLITKPLLLK